MKTLFTITVYLLSSILAVAQTNQIVETLPTRSGKIVKIHPLMHASIHIEYDNVTIDIDPVKELGQKRIDYSLFSPATYIFITHEHSDHFSQATIDAISNNSTKIFTNDRCADLLGYGFRIRNGQLLQITNSISVEAVPAYNTTKGRESFHPKGRDNGYVLTIENIKIYIAGDTENIPEMENLKNIDIAFLPCNQPYTMTVEQVVEAAKIIRPKVLIPYHYSSTDISSLPSLLNKYGIDVKIREL